MQIDLVLFTWNKTSKLGKSVFIFKYFTRCLRTLLISYNDCRKSEFSCESFCFLLCLFVYDAFFFYSGVEAAMNWVLEHMEDSGMVRFPFL